MTTQADYASIAGMNWSTLKALAVSPLYFKYRLDHPEPDKPAWRIGRALHCSVLEVARWLTDYVGAPDFGDLRFKENKAAKTTWLAENAGREVLSFKEWENITNAGQAARAHRVAGNLLSEWRNEEVITWTDADTGLACKGRVDHFTSGSLIDLKKARDVSPWRFSRAVADYLYAGQLAHYFDGAIAAGVIPPDAERPIIVAVQIEPPYDVACYRLSAGALAAGRELRRQLLRKFVECQAADVWPGVAPDLLELDLPPWAAGMVADETEEESEDF